MGGVFRFILIFNSLFVAGSLRSENQPSDEHVFLLGSVDHAEQLLQDYPSSDYFILNYGPTTGVMSALFRERLKNVDRSKYYSELMLSNLAIYDGRSKELERKLFDVFDQVVPDQTTLRGRTLVINRVLWAGHTISEFVDIFNEYIKKRRPDIKVKYHVVARRGVASQLEQFFSNRNLDSRVVEDNRFALAAANLIDWTKVKVPYGLRFADTKLIKWDNSTHKVGTAYALKVEANSKKEDIKTTSLIKKYQYIRILQERLWEKCVGLFKRIGLKKPQNAKP